MIGSGLLAIISVVVAALKKRPIANDLFDQINSVFGLFGSSVIVEAEKSGKTGPEKLQIALDRLIYDLKRYIKLSSDDEAFARVVFERKIEGALETPRKK